VTPLANTYGRARLADRVALATGVDPRLLALLGVLAAIWLVLDALTGGLFLSPRNLFNLSAQVAVVAIMASGMIMVIVARQIDLSVGSQLGVISVFGALMQTEVLAPGGAATWWLSSLAMLAAGLLIGLLQGALVAYARIPSFVVTLGGLLFFRNAAYELNAGRTISPLDPTFQMLGGGIDGTIGALWSWVLGAVAVVLVIAGMVRTRQRRRRYGFPLRQPAVELALMLFWVVAIAAFVATMNGYRRPGSGEPMGLAIPVLILIGVTVAMTVLARRHRFGRHIYAVGGDPDSAQLAGIASRRVIVGVFALMGLLCGVASIVVTGRLNAGASGTGTMTELNVIAAAVVGGTSLEGGLGTISGGLLGAVVMQSLESGMVLLGVSSPLQKMVLAAVLIVAVWFDMAWRRRVQT
jgi:D-xylose transport system permease protein